MIIRKQELVLQRLMKQGNHLSCLINNAGIVTGRRLLELSAADIKRTFGVNILSHFWTVKGRLVCSWLVCACRKSNSIYVSLSFPAFVGIGIGNGWWTFPTPLHNRAYMPRCLLESNNYVNRPNNTRTRLWQCLRWWAACLASNWLITARGEMAYMSSRITHGRTRTTTIDQKH